MPSLATVLQVAGAALLSAGTWLAFGPAAALGVAGGAAVLFGIAAERGQ